MKKILIQLVILFCVFTGYAQPGLIKKEIDKKGSVIFAEFRTDTLPKPMTESKQLLSQLLALDQDEEFVLTESKTDELGFTHYYFNQYYKGKRVAYSAYSVHGRNNIVSTVNGTYNKIGKVYMVAELAEKEALGYATRFVNAKVYKWELPEEEQWLKDNYNESYYPKGELVIVKDRMKTNQIFRLAWKFNVYAHIPLGRNLIYVDAITGDILDTESKIYFANSPGTAATRYSDTRPISTDSFSGGFRLRETRNSVRIETYNMKSQGTSYSGAPDFVDNNNNWTDAEFSNTNMDNAALDAHWGTEMVYDYFKTLHDRNSWNGSGGPLLNYVHTNLIAMGYLNNVNAFWDGQRMTYGDGNDCFEPLTSLDIVAHEIGHGINSSSAKMKYEGESGALNESLSDIWGACVEQWSVTGKQTWLNGEDVTFCTDAFRSMSDPNTHGQPDTYQSPLPENEGFWYDTDGCTPNQANDNCGVHTNSGVPNFWFFLLVNGGTGTNDINNCYNITGITIDHAARIVYRAETVILASSNEQTVSFNQFRNATITAASNLYGVNSIEVVSVTNAWNAVGVGDQYLYQISGNSAVCSTGTIYRVDNLPYGSTVSWTCSSNISFDNQTGNPKTFTAIGTNLGWVLATANIPNCGTLTLPLKTVWLGKPQITVSSISNLQDMGYSNYYKILPATGNYAYEGTLTVAVLQLAGVIDYSWSFYSNIPKKNIAYWSTSENTVDAGAKTSNAGEVLKYTTYNTCGESYNLFTFFTGDMGTPPPPPLVITPNPATTQTEASFDGADIEASDITIHSTPSNNNTYTVSLMNSSGVCLYSASGSEKKFTIPTSSLKNGTYIVRITDGKNVQQGNLVVSH